MCNVITIVAMFYIAGMRFDMEIKFCNFISVEYVQPLDLCNVLVDADLRVRPSEQLTPAMGMNLSSLRFD